MLFSGGGGSTFGGEELNFGGGGEGANFRLVEGGTQFDRNFITWRDGKKVRKSTIQRSEPFLKVRNSHPKLFLRKGVLKIYIKFTGEHPCRIVISIKLLCNFIEITFWHGCSINLLYIFRTPLPKNTSGLLLL